MPVYSEISAWVRSQINEASPVKWSDAEVLRAYDFAQKDWSIRTEVLRTQFSISTTASTGTYALTSFPRILKVKKVIYKYGTQDATPLNYFDYQDYPWPQKTQTNRSTAYTVYDDKLELLFIPNESVTLQVLYTFSASDITSTVAFSANNYTNPIIPERHQLYAANLAVSNLVKKFESGHEIAKDYLSLYEKYIQEQIMLTRRPTDDSHQLYFKSLPSPAFGNTGGYGSGNTLHPLWP